MDSFMNLAKQGMEAYSESQKKSSNNNDHSSSSNNISSHGQQGDQQYGSGAQTSGGSYGSQQSTGGYGSQQSSGNYGSQQPVGESGYGSQQGEGQYGIGAPQPNTGRYSPPIDKHEAINTAKAHGSGDSSLFDTALGFLSNNKSTQHEPIDEDEVTKAHDKVYNQGNAGGMSANLLGSAAAMQILKQFTGGNASSGSANSQTNLISMAMAEATKLFDKSGGSASGDKQDAVNGAAMTIMKMLVQSKLGGGDPTVGGSNSGGLSGLLSMASKFAK